MWREDTSNCKLPEVCGSGVTGSSFVFIHSDKKSVHVRLSKNARCQREMVEEGWNMLNLQVQVQNI